MAELRDKISIETPEQISLEYNLAGIGSRFLALAFDTLLQFVVYFILFVVIAFLLPDLGNYWPSAWNWVAALYVLLAFTLYWGYYAVFEALWKGQTPGKRQAKIRVIKDSGRSINAFEAIARNLLRVVDQLPGFYGVGIISVFLDSKNRRLGDFVAGTVVVHEAAEEEVEPMWTTRREAATQATPAHMISRLGAAELEVIETFLHRRIDLEPGVRAATAARIVSHLAARMDGAKPEGVSNEDFLESVALEIRNQSRYR